MKSIIKVALLTASNSRSAGGLFVTISELSKALLRKKVKISVISHDDIFSDKDKLAYEDVPLIRYSTYSKISIFKQLGYSLELHRIIKTHAPIIIHQQGLWMYHSYAALRYKESNPNIIKIIEPHGMLDSWALRNSAWKKKIVGYLFEYKNLQKADCIHALCKSEYESIRKFGLKNPVAIIPNGIVIPKLSITNRNNVKKTLLFIGRIHPKKGLKELIMGLTLIRKKYPSFFNEWQLRIAGWSQVGHLEELKCLISEGGIENCIELIGPIYGEKKSQELINANAFILPSFSEGLPMSILEAWAYRLPVIMTDYCNLPEGFSTNSAIRIEPNPESIACGLEQLINLTEQDLGKMGNNGLELVKKHFSWEHIALQTIQLYEYLLNGGQKPDFVYE